jgi:hypothetical protein
MCHRHLRRSPDKDLITNLTVPLLAFLPIDRYSRRHSNWLRLLCDGFCWYWMLALVLLVTLPRHRQERQQRRNETNPITFHISPSLRKKKRTHWGM